MIDLGVTGLLGEPAILLLVFGCAGLAAYFAQLGLRGTVQERARTAARYAALGGRPDETELDLLRRRAGHAAWGPVAALAALVLQSGTRVPPRRIALLFLGGALLLTLLVPSGWGWPLRLLAGLTVAAGTTLIVLRIKRARRIARFAEQLPDLLDIIVRSLRAGHPLPTALVLVAREVSEPAGPEFSLLVDEVNYGRDLSEALENLHARVGYPEMRYMVTSIAIANQTGGNLGEVLSRLATMLRLRFRLRRRVRALSAEGRFSGLALSALPVLLFLIINLVSPTYYAEFWTSPSASTVVGVALAMLIAGNLTIYRMVNFRV